MPDDSNDAFKGSQSQHAQKIQFERRLMEQTGLSRNEIRSRLRSASDALEQKATKPIDSPEPSPVSLTLPPFPRAPQQFDPKPFAPQPSAARVPLSPPGEEGGGLPAGSAGDMLYHNGSDWVVLSAPTVTDYDPVLRHNGTSPYWQEPEEC